MLVTLLLLSGRAVTSPPAADPIVLPDCRLNVVEKQEVPSQRDGILLLVGTDIKPGETVPPERVVVLKYADQERRLRRLMEGDAVEAGQLLALLDDRLARDDWAIKKGQIVLAEAELAAAERARDEAKDRYLTQLKLHSAPGGPAASDEEVAGAKLLWYRNHYDAISKKEAIDLAHLELHRAATLLGLYEVRSSIGGVIKRIHRNPGEAIKALEPVVEVRNLRRLRVEGLVAAQHLPRLHAGLRGVVRPVPAESPRQTFHGHLREVTAVAVARDGAVVSAGEDGTIRVWNRTSRRAQRVLNHSAPVRAVACTPSPTGNNLCLAGAGNGTAYLWDLEGKSDAPGRELRGQHRGAVTAVAFSPDGKVCATAGEDHGICLWEVATGGVRYRLPAGHHGAITGLQWSPADRLISVGRDNTVRLWRIGPHEAKLETTLDHRTGDVARLGASRDGNRVLFDEGNTLHVLSLPEGGSEGVLQNLAGSAPFTTLGLFSPDDRFLLTAGGFENRLHLWRSPAEGAAGYEVRHLLPPAGSAVTCAAFAPDGSFVAAGTRNRQVLVWPLPPAQELDRQYPVTLTLVEQAVDSTAGKVRVWAELPNPDGRLVPGGPVTMTLYPND